MPTINELQDEIIEEFSALDDWMDRYALIIDLGNTLEPLPESDKTPTNIIEGCQSRVWITASYSDGKVHFRGESDAIIVKGIAPFVRPWQKPITVARHAYGDVYRNAEIYVSNQAKAELKVITPENYTGV